MIHFTYLVRDCTYVLKSTRTNATHQSYFPSWEIWPFRKFTFKSTLMSQRLIHSYTFEHNSDRNITRNWHMTFIQWWFQNAIFLIKHSIGRLLFFPSNLEEKTSTKGILPIWYLFNYLYTSVMEILRQDHLTVCIF